MSNLPPNVAHAIAAMMADPDHARDYIPATALPDPPAAPTPAPRPTPAPNPAPAPVPEPDDCRPPGVMLYFDLYEPFKSMPPASLGTLILSLMEYLLYDAEPSPDPTTAFAWSFLKSYADRDRKRYAAARARRQAAAEKRWSRYPKPDAAKPEPPSKPAPKPTPKPTPKPEPPAVTEPEEPVASPEWVKQHMYFDKDGVFHHDFS